VRREPAGGVQVLAFYAARAAEQGWPGAKSGAVTVVQGTSSDLRLNPHLHLVVLDGAWHEDGGELAWEALSHLRTSEVGEVLERVVRRMERHLRRSGLRRLDEDDEDPEGNLAASAVSGQAPPAGPQWRKGLAPLEPHALAYDKPRCASLDGFTLHADTRAGAQDAAGREALLRYVLRPPLARGAAGAPPARPGAHRPEEGLRRRDPGGGHGPLSLLCRLATSVPPPRLHTVKYAGVLAPASVTAGSRARDGPRSGGACAWGRIDATRLPPVKGQRASPASAGVGKRPGCSAPRRSVDERTALVLPSADLRPQPMRGSAPVPASASGSRPA